MKTETESTDSHNRQSASVPRAMIHKQVLDVARSRPSISMEEIADEVSNVNVDIVENVLEQYGDPGRSIEEAEQGTESNSSQQAEMADKNHQQMSDQDQQHSQPSGSMPEIKDLTNGDPVDEVLSDRNLTDKQLETLRTIYAHPEETQAEIAERLGISKSTVNTRVNSIDGFEWSKRGEFIRSMFENNESAPEGMDSGSKPIAEVTEQLNEIVTQMKTIERQLENQTGTSKFTIGDPELAHKVVHACLNSDNITEDEELLLLKEAISPKDSIQRDR